MNKRVYQAVISGKSDNNIDYKDFQNLILSLGFKLQRQKGSHVRYRHNGVKKAMSIQKDGNKAKPYQVKQLRNIIINNNL